MISENRKNKFLRELAELTLKHKISIAACGCCGSPWLADESDALGGHYEVNKNKSTYERLSFAAGKSE